MDIDNKYGMLERQKSYLPLMKDLDLYCKQNNIEYSLAYGSLLGTVRHKGFIPWDYDVDIMMTRNNYEKFISCFESYPMEGYILVGHLWIKKLTLQNNPFLDNEIQCIDIFILDVVPNNKFLEKIKVLLLKFLQGMMKEKVDYRQYSLFNKVLVFITHFLGIFFTKEFKDSFYSAISQWHGFSNVCRRLSIYNTIYAYMGQTFSDSIVSSYKYLNFENCKFMCISNYDEYLKNVYGDYMTPPPEDKRKPRY